ncbi:SusC/RagA family TonB-linked outer membrane protein [Bacteroides sp. 224]|uniref:SusC/RagA family TonB-linked outer membrane protein n=1 Tax=Bacteroides sp. 224 TaxID=2302936 RepID=UPI0013D3896D|nr:SusC/RagA family TonB-linked outer membrane protein [Bacteroides sp. 224]NDV64981.1 SusC/RagA family TonB-linked outer membrane protein [Bacteroides sp. 224]
MERKRKCSCSGIWSIKHLKRIALLSVGTLIFGCPATLHASEPVFAESVQQEKRPETVVIKGFVRDRLTNTPLPGVNISDSEKGGGTISHADGSFSLNVAKRDRITLQFTFIGMKTLNIVWNGKPSINVLMEEDFQSISEVVVTGIFERKAESFTGSAATFNTDQLRNIGSQNVLQSLKSLDPSITITESELFGSDPNRLPDLDIQGKTSINDPRNNYTTDPNQPLYVIDGFEATARDVVNLNINRIESLTVLKDAASTAIWGSKAANGVIVIETIKPQPGKIRVEYGGSFGFDIPDLSDYNLMNAAEKIEFERLSGAYNSNDPYLDHNFKELYNQRLRNVLSGVDTYWLKEPIRTGFSHKHNVSVNGGDDTFIYNFGLNYGETQGAMKKSGNDLLGLNVDLQYRTNKMRFQNKTTIESYNEWNPPVSFSEYAEANPYFEKVSGTQPLYLEEFVVDGGGVSKNEPFRSPNPLYNEGLNHINENKNLTFKNNFFAEWRPIDGLKIQGRLMVELRRNKSELFKSPYHTDFATTVANERGEHKKTTNDGNKYSGDITAAYYKLFKEKHQLNLVLTGKLSSEKYITDGYKAVGFASDVIPYPSFSQQNEPNKKPEYNQTEIRANDYFINGGYVFDQRYAFDATLRYDGSSNFGSSNLYTTTWSTGIAWNIHHEKFAKDLFDLLKIRFSVGNPGNNNSKYYTTTTYQYMTQANLFGNGLHINQFGSTGLDWEKTLKYNLGFDLTTRNSRFSMVVDLYKKISDPLIVRLDLPASTGRENLQTNMGRNTIKGIDFKANYNIINRGSERILWGIGINGSSKTAKYSKMGDLSKLNDYMRDEASSLRRFANGYSQYDLWAVPSAGIDPGTGKETFIKKNGEYTFTYDKADEVRIGSSEPDLSGRISTNLVYKGWSASIILHYIIRQDKMNTFLQNRVEGLDRDKVLLKNQDKRALYDRWIKPGDHAKFKDITDIKGTTSYLSSRFMQTENLLSGESISVGYDFAGHNWLEKAHLENLSVRAIFNNIFHCSTIKQERGIDYPFARTAQLTVNVTF